MIKVTEISKTYGLNHALANVSFSVEKGEIVGLVGRNGAGKSTTMNIITGYLAPDSGSVEINGFDIMKDPVRAKENLGYMPEFPPLYPDMSVEKYLRFVCELMRVPKAEIAAQMEEIDDSHFRKLDALEYAKAGTLQEKIDELFDDNTGS